MSLAWILFEIGLNAFDAAYFMFFPTLKCGTKEWVKKWHIFSYWVFLIAAFSIINFSTDFSFISLYIFPILIFLYIVIFIQGSFVPRIIWFIIPFVTMLAIETSIGHIFTSFTGLSLATIAEQTIYRFYWSSINKLFDSAFCLLVFVLHIKGIRYLGLKRNVLLFIAVNVLCMIPLASAFSIGSQGGIYFYSFTVYIPMLLLLINVAYYTFQIQTEKRNQMKLDFQEQNLRQEFQSEHEKEMEQARQEAAQALAEVQKELVNIQKEYDNAITYLKRESEAALTRMKQEYEAAVAHMQQESETAIVKVQKEAAKKHYQVLLSFFNTYNGFRQSIATLLQNAWAKKTNQNELEAFTEANRILDFNNPTDIEPIDMAFMYLRYRAANCGIKINIETGLEQKFITDAQDIGLIMGNIVNKGIDTIEQIKDDPDLSKEIDIKLFTKKQKYLELLIEFPTNGATNYSFLDRDNEKNRQADILWDIITYHGNSFVTVENQDYYASIAIRMQLPIVGRYPLGKTDSLPLPLLEAQPLSG